MDDWLLISKGAEAEIYKGIFYGYPAIKKVRFPKKYRHPVLDIKIRRTRTRREARLLNLAKKANVPAPYVFYVNELECILIMEFIEGDLLRRTIRNLEIIGDIDRALEYIHMSGKLLARLHEAGIIHGDYTTSNIIVTPKGELFVIDFGLGYFTGSSDPEDYAVELRVFSRGLEIYHYGMYNKYWSAFLEGYREENARAETIIQRTKEIFMRGRYVVERRKKRLFIPR